MTPPPPSPSVWRAADAGPLRIAIVGLGARSHYWMDAIDASPDLRVAALVDPAPAARQRAAARYPGLPVTAELTDALDQAEADAVLIVTPPFGREQIVAVCVARKLAVLAEKPLADSLALATAYVEAAETAGIPLMVVQNFRYMPVSQATRRLFDGPAGRPRFGRFTYERWRDGHQAHLNKYPLTMAEPMLWEQSIHHFDLMRFVYDAEPVEIYARTFNPPWSMYAGNANVSAVITFDSGLVVNYQGTWAANWRPMAFDWRTECDNGVVIQSDQFGDLAMALRDDPTPTPVPLPPYRQWYDDAVSLLDVFAAALRGERPLECSGRDHLASLSMVEACTRSSREGRAINPSSIV